MSVMYSIGFEHTKEGIRCSEIGLSDLMTEGECRRAVAYAHELSPGASFGNVEFSKHSPKGCYVSIYSNKVYWNTNIGHGTYVWARSICKSGNN